jgi:hypothetical protein
MSISDDDRSGRNPRPPRRNRLAVISVAAAAVLGGGAYLVTSRAGDRDGGTVTGDTGALAPPATSPLPSPPSVALSPETPSSAAPAAAVPASAAPASAAPPPASRRATVARPTRAAGTAEVRRQIDAARQKAAEDGIPLQRPLVASTAAPAHDADSYAEQSRRLAGGGTMRIISARYDLSGQREMLWAADRGHPVGDVRCTNNFHFSATGVATVRPTMLLCWRTSDDRSVVVLTVAKNPSGADSAGVIDKRWNELR